MVWCGVVIMQWAQCAVWCGDQWAQCAVWCGDQWAQCAVLCGDQWAQCVHTMMIHVQYIRN